MGTTLYPIVYNKMTVDGHVTSSNYRPFFSSLQIKNNVKLSREKKPPEKVKVIGAFFVALSEALKLQSVVVLTL